MAAPAPPWPIRVRERVIEAEALCDESRGMLRAAVERLASPMPQDDDGRARAGLIGVELLAANIGLASAAASLAAAEVLALRGAAADPTDPLPSVADIPDAHEIERRALGMLRRAMVYAEAAYDVVGWCCDRLLTAYNLLDHPDLPGVDCFVDAEREAAHVCLDAAENIAGVSAAYAYTALCVLLPD
nr:unnamed protein product [Digitaria exilis]